MALVDDAAVYGIRIEKQDQSSSALAEAYYCHGGPNYSRVGRWVTVTKADNDATKLAAIQAALS